MSNSINNRVHSERVELQNWVELPLIRGTMSCQIVTTERAFRRFYFTLLHLKWKRVEHDVEFQPFSE